MNAENSASYKNKCFDHHYMLGMRLDYASIDTFKDQFIQSAQYGISTYCCVPDVYQCVTCYDNESHRDIVNGADYVISDSVILQSARALRHGVPAISTMLGSELMLALCKEAESRGVRVCLLGGRDDSALALIERELVKKYPALQIAYKFAPPFRQLTRGEEDKMLREISQSGATLIFIGIGCPKQEQWMARYKGRIHGSMIGVGAAFDTIGGLVRSSPGFIHRFGLEWLFRLVREPRRLYRRYLISAPRFVWLILVDWMRSAIRRDPRPHN